VASNLTIRRMMDQVDDLEIRFGLPLARSWRAAFVYSHESLDQDAVLERHYQLFPEDRAASIIFRVIYEGCASPREPILNMTGNGKADKAWRQIAAEGELAA